MFHHQIDALRLAIVTNDRSGIQEIIVSAKESSLIQLLFAFCKKVSQRSCGIRSLNNGTVDSVIAECTDTFFGLSSLYLLDCTQAVLTKEAACKLVSFLSYYSGPNFIIVVSGELGFSTIDRIIIPKRLARADFLTLIPFLYNIDPFTIYPFIQEVYLHCKDLSLSEALCIGRYAAVVGVKNDHFFTDWLPLISEEMSPLRLLSSALLLRSTKQFYSLWHRLKMKYPPQFWISFWSDTIWRAALFVVYKNKNETRFAREVSFGLPIKFMQTEWHRYQFAWLLEAHGLIASLDDAIKNSTLDILQFERLFQYFFMDFHHQKNQLSAPEYVQKISQEE